MHHWKWQCVSPLHRLTMAGAAAPLYRNPVWWLYSNQIMITMSVKACSIVLFYQDFSNLIHFCDFLAKACLGVLWWTLFCWWPWYTKNVAVELILTNWGPETKCVARFWNSEGPKLNKLLNYRIYSNTRRVLYFSWTKFTASYTGWQF